MALLTLAATTRRVASAKGNYSKADAIAGKQYPKDGGRKKTVSEPSAEIKKLQDKMNAIIKGWYNSGGKTLLNLGEDADNWDTIINLVDKLYDPVFAGGHLPSTLCDSSSLGAAIFASLATVIEEKLSVLCGDEGVLLRSKDHKSTALLLSNDTLSDIFMSRINKMARAKKRNTNDAKEKEMLLYRMSKLKEAPLPHRLSLFEKFGNETRKEDISSSASAVAGTTIASSMHCKLMNHVFKVAFRKSGPGRQRQRTTPLAETHALSKYVLEYMNGRGDFYPHDPDSASIFYCDYDDFKAYQALPDKFKMSSIVPGSHNMEDLPFRPFAVPAHYKTGGGTRIFKYERAVPVNSGVCFDYGEFLCYCVFGMEWDKHLGDIVDALDHSSMINFSPDTYSGVFKDTHDFNRLGNMRMGIVDFALRSVAEFIRSEAYDAANKEEEEEEEEEEENVLSTLRNVIRNSVRQIRSLLKEDLPDIVSRFKRDLPAGDYGEPGEFECLTAHLFLTRLLDECHILRNVDIQRTVFSTRISLTRRSIIAPRGTTNVQTYSSVEEIPEGVLAGLSGDDEGAAVVSWDGSAGKVIGVWRRNVAGHHLSDHESVAKKYKDDLKLVKKIKDVLREASERGGLNPVFFNREAIYRALHARGIFVPGTNLTETGKSFEGLRNLEEDENAIFDEINVGEFRGALSGLRDILETKALTVYTRDAFREAGEGIRAEAEALRTTTATETALVESFRTDASLGLEFSAETQSLVLKDTGKSLLEETKALRANRVAFSSVMKDMGVQVSKDLDAEFAAEMRETYPDTAIREYEESVREFEKNIPESQVREIERISTESGGNLEEMEQKIGDTELSKTTDSALAKKLGNGVLVFVGRFATVSVLVGTATVAGFLGPAVVGTMHASKGAHLNVVCHTSKNGVTSYKITDFSCADQKLGWAKRAAHPFREEIDDVIKSDSDFKLDSGAYVIKKEGGARSKNKAWAPICGSNDAKVSDCGSWATFEEPHSVLPWVTDLSKLPKGQSLTCDKGMTATQALVDTLKSLGGDVVSAIIDVVGDAVAGAAEKAFSTVINSPAFIAGIPVAAGIAATKLQPDNWKTGLAVGLAVLVLILIVRFFAGSGAFTLDWFNDKSKRKYTEAYEMGKITKKQKRGVEERVDIKLRPAFLPATTNYSRAAKIIGADVTLFADCYRDVRHKMMMMMPSSMDVTTFAHHPGDNESILFDAGLLGEDSFTPQALAPRNKLSSGNNIVTLTATAHPGNFFIGPENVSGSAFVIRGDTKMPTSINASPLPSDMKKTAIISFMRSSNGQELNILNTHESESLYVYPMKDELEYNTVSLPSNIIVPAASSVSVPIGRRKKSLLNARRLFFSCNWQQPGEELPSALPAMHHILNDDTFSRTSSVIGKNTSASAAPVTRFMDLLAMTVGYLKIRGYPTRYLLSAAFMDDTLKKLEGYDLNKFLAKIKEDAAGSLEEISNEEMRENIEKLKRLRTEGDVMFDVAISLGLYYC